MKSDLFPTTELKGLTLAQLLLEHEKDWVEYHGLQKGIFWTARHFGLEHAKNIAKQKVSHLFSSQTLDQRLEQEAAELEENEREIRERAEAWKCDGYRERNLVDHVKQRLDLLDTDVTDEDLEKISKFVDDHLRAVKEQLESSGELARQRQAELDQKHPKASLGRIVGKVKNGLIEKKRILVPAAVGIAFGAAGSGGAYHYFSNQDRNRPTEEIGSVIDSEHPGVRMTVAVIDTVRAGNELFKRCKYDEGTSIQSIKDKSAAIITKVKQAKSETKKAQEYYARTAKNISALVAGSAQIWDAWNHHKEESGHWKTVCTTSTDAKGRTTTQCHQEYHCDYIDHTWTFHLETAASGVDLYLRGLSTLGNIIPAGVSQPEIETQIKTFLSKDKKYSLLSVEDQEKRKRPYADVFTSITIAGNNALRNFLSNADSASFSFIKNNYKNDYIFSHETRERNHSCSSRGNPPQAYVVSEAFFAQANDLGKHYNNLTGRMKNTAEHLKAYEETLAKIEKTAANPETKELLEQLGDQVIVIQDEINPNSEYSMLTSGWRTAIPFMLLFGLGGLGVGAGYAGVSAFDRRRRQREFLGKYGTY